MAAKLLHSLADENPDLQKQIGCMTGIFQIFDRHQVITGRRLNHKRLPQATSHFHNGGSEGEFSNLYQQQTATEMNTNRSVNEKQRLSVESSRASFSSSCSSSLSSVDCNKPAQLEALSFDRITFPDMPSRDPVIEQGSISPHLGRNSLDLRDVVKDSMYREARGLSVRTISKEEAPPRRSLKHKDSPRPLQLSKTEKNIPDDFNESLRVLSKLREAPWYSNEGRELSRSQHEAKDGSWFSVSKDAPRFSFDRREINRLSLDSRDTTYKSTPRLKELPRLSLDGREGSIEGSNSNSKPMYLFKNFPDEKNNQRSGFVDLSQRLETQKRPPSVVAKLMGLDALPDTTLASNSQLSSTKTLPIDDRDPSLRSLKANNRNKPIRVSNSPRSSLKDPVSPRWRNPDLIMKPLSSSKFPIEPAPWRHPDGSRGTNKTGFKPVKVPVRTPDSFPSVYSEIEKRLKDLEFKHSGKDLRALKQILEAMQSKGILYTREEEEASTFETPRGYEPLKSSAPNQKPRSQRNPQNANVIASTNRRSNALRTFESPIVIMKPAKLVQQSNIPDSSIIPLDSLSSLQKLRNKGFEESKRNLMNTRTGKDQSPKSIQVDSAVSTSDKKTNSRNIRSSQSARESSPKSTGSVSPRLQQRKLELDKRSRPPTPPSDLNKSRRQSNQQQPDLGTRGGGKNKKKSQKSTHFDDQSSQISNESRTSSYHGDDSSVQSDAEFTSNEHVLEFNGSQSPSLKAASFTFSDSEQKKSIPRLNEDGLSAEPGMVTPEHPSPVSVFDAPVIRDDEPSPVKQMPITLEGTIAQNSSDDSQTEDRRSTENNDFLVSSLASGVTSNINRKKLQNIDHLVQKLRRLNSSHDETNTDYIASLCESTNPDHRYISEILLASGLLLRDLGSNLTIFQFHPSGQPINPELFFVLEQTNATNALHSKEECVPVKVSRSKPDQEKFHRKLIFDAVNEILGGKLASVGASQEPWLKTDKLTRKTLSAQKLLKELCSEIEQLQAKKHELTLDEEDDDLKSILWEDVMHRSDSWTSFHSEISGLVLDVERLVFKDLVNEIVIGEAANLQTKQGRRRQLFSS